MSKKVLVVSVACALALAWIPIRAGAGKGNGNSAVGFCNATISQSMGTLNQIVQGRNQSSNCAAVATTLNVLADAGCGDLYTRGKLATSKYRPDGPTMTTICKAVVDICEFELPSGACSG